jgi:hypothetical protein
MEYILIGNSITRHIQPEGFMRTICLPGANLNEILKVASNTGGVRVLLGGIPDIAKKYHHYTTPSMVTRLYQAIGEFESLPGNAILLPFYPTGYLDRSEWGLVEAINERIKKANRKRGEVIPNILEGVFKGNGSRPYLNRSFLSDDVHPCKNLCEKYETLLGKWRKNRIVKTNEEPSGGSSTQTRLEQLVQERKRLDTEILVTQRRLKYEKDREQLMLKHQRELEELEDHFRADIKNIESGKSVPPPSTTTLSDAYIEAELLIDTCQSP